MKRCPKCDFTFADFHHVCDFDGTELVDDPERPPSALKVSTSPSRFLRFLKSPLFLTGLAVLALLSSALLIGYYDSASRPNSIVENRPSQNSFARVIPSVPTPAQSSSQTRTPKASSRRSPIGAPSTRKDSASKLRRPMTASAARSRLRSSASAKNQQSKSQTALQKESKESANEK
jgi:hypothetical protein